MMIISPSTAACERAFSCMNRQKRRARCNLSERRWMIRINDGGQNIPHVYSSSSLHRWIGEAMGSQHLNSTRKYKQIDQVEIGICRSMFEIERSLLKHRILAFYLEHIRSMIGSVTNCSHFIGKGLSLCHSN